MWQQDRLTPDPSPNPRQGTEPLPYAQSWERGGGFFCLLPARA
jgi:hypothetical protein